MGIIKFIFTDLIFIWLPVFLFYFMYHLWEHYIKDKAISSIDWTLMEVRVPLDIQKSPLAVEVFLINALYHKPGDDWWTRFVDGPKHYSVSLEMASFGGDVRFFVRAPKPLARLVESQLYAQFPQVEISETKFDYASKISRIKKDSKYDMWGLEFSKQNNEVFPIKTYVDFGLDKLDLKDEYKVDPLSSIYELLSSIKPGEQIWIQYVVRRSYRGYGGHGHGGHDYTEEIEVQLKKLISKYNVPKVDPKTGAVTYEIRIPETTDKDKIDGLRNAARKVPFDVGIRVIYVAEREKFDGSIRSGMKIMYSQFGQPTINQLKGYNGIGFDWPWQDFRGSLDAAKTTLLDNYKKREFFHPSIIGDFGIPFFSLPGKGHFNPDQTPVYCVYNSEELASLWHFPGRSISTPSIGRIETKTSKPPANLPF